jgi:hypothetical protein
MTETRNPYTAPTAVVDDVRDPASNAPPLHPHVRRACLIMWWSFAIGLLSTPLTLKGELGAAGDGAGVVGTVVGLIFGFLVAFALIWWVTSKLRAGRNWMRWLVNIFTVIGILAVLLMLATGSQVIADTFSDPAQSVISALNWTLTVIELVLINTPSAREWFAEMKQHTR